MENRALKGDHVGGRLALVHAEELKVAAEVENVEFLLVRAVQQAGAEPGAAANHLPELGLAHNLFEKHQVEHLRHINAGVQHVHGNGDLRQLLRVGKFVNGALRVGHIVVYDLRKAGQMGIFFMEHRKDFLRMGVIFCKDDGLAQLAAVIDGQAVCHQGIQNLPDGVLVEDPFVQSGGRNALRQIAVFILKGVLISLLVRVGKLVVDNALLDEFQLCLYRQEVHQISVLDGLRQFVAIGGHTVLQLKNLVSILVDLVLGCGSQAHQRRVEIVENIPVFVVNRAVRLVTDHQIKMPAGEELSLLVLHAVNDIEHGLIGGKDTVSGVVVLLLAEVGDGEIGQQIHKAALGLRDQTVAVSQKQDIFHPAVLEQHIAKGDDRSGLAGAGGHDQQRLAAVAGKGVTGGLDGALLIVASGDVPIHHDIFQARPHGLEIEQLFQVPLGVDGGTFALGIEIVNDVGLEAVGQKDDRAAVILLFQQVGVQLCLLAGFGHIHAGALGLNDCQRATIIAVEHIVGIADLALVGHTGQLYLVEPVLALCPACVGEHGVDIDLAGLVFRQVKGLRHIGLLLLVAAGGELLFQGGIFRHKGSQIHLRHFLHRRSRRFGRLRQKAAVKMPLGVMFGVAIGHKVQKDIEVFQTQRRLLLGDLLPRVGGVVADAANEVHPPPDVRAYNVTEVLGVHQT